MTRRLPLMGALGALLLGTIAWTARDERSFGRVLLLEAEGTTSAGVSLGDVDRDGDLDVLLARGRHWPLENRLFRNDGRGHFVGEPIAESADRTYTAALADLDGDGDLDAVVSNDRPDRKLLYLNDGRGYFQVAGTFGDAAWSTRYVTVAELDGDGRPDLVVANRSSNPANPRPSFVCLNDGRGGFPACTPLATQSATIIVAADYDGDGHVDLFVPHRDGGQSLLFWNDGRGGFAGAPTPVGAAPSHTRAAVAADLDGDGRADLVTGDERAGLFVHRNTGARAFAPPTRVGDGAASPYALGAADLDRNGTMDIVVGHDNAVGTVHFNDGARAGTPLRFTAVPWNDGKGAVYGLAIGDLDGDGWPDIAAARSDAPNGIWFSEPARR